jgi:hypothetical protein
MRVRRDTAGGTGDDDEADIAFDTSLTDPTISLDSAISNASAGVTATTLGQFLNVGTVNGTTYTNPDSLSGTASCFVDEWKDQSANANHASQATFGSQPQIHDGTVDTDLITENGKPALDFSSDVLTSGAITSTGDQTFAFVTKIDATSGLQIVASSGGSALYNSGGTARYQSKNAGDSDIDYGSYTTNQMLHFVYHDNATTANSFGRINAVQQALNPSTNGKWSKIVLGEYDATGGFYYNGNIQEFIFWTIGLADEKTAIETDINDYFSIY